MLTVRFPDGTSITYHEANRLVTSQDRWEIYTAMGGKWIASIMPHAGCIVEATTSVKIENPVDQLTDDHALDYVVKHIEEYSDWRYNRRLRQLKAKLSRFDAKRGVWK
jgi:hypothetical protein